jgi:hypothetical protein
LNNTVQHAKKERKKEKNRKYPFLDILGLPNTKMTLKIEN